MHDAGLLIARLLLGVPFIIWGFLKLRGGEAKLVPVLAAMGLPDATLLAYLVGLCELVGGLGVALGYPVRSFSVLLGLWCLVTAYAAHRKQLGEVLSHMAMAGGFFALAVAGAGAIALFGGDPAGLLADVQ